MILRVDAWTRCRAYARVVPPGFGSSYILLCNTEGVDHFCFFCCVYVSPLCICVVGGIS